MRRSTIRKLPPLTREFAKLVNEMDSIARRLKNRLEKVERIENGLALAEAELRGKRRIKIRKVEQIENDLALAEAELRGKVGTRAA